MSSDYLTPLLKVTSVNKFNDGICFSIDHELADIVFYKADMVRLRISQGGKFVAKASSACIKSDWSGAEFTLDEREDYLTLVSSHLIITIEKNPFSICIKRTDGSIILDSRAATPYYQFQNNHFVVNRDCKANDHIYGLGEKTGFLDRHGRKLTMWNTDVLAPDPDKSVKEYIASRDKNPLDTDFDPYYISIPFFTKMSSDSLLASGHFIDNPYKGEFDFNNQKNDSHINIHFSGGQYCEYIFAGPSIKSILHDYTQLTGRIEAPPLWSLGYHQCRWKKYSQSQFLKLAEKQKQSGVPCDVLWLDIDYMDEYRVFTWDDEQFPNRSEMFSKLTKMGLRVVTIVDPGIKYEDGYKIFDEAKQNDLLCKCENGQIYIGQVWPGKTAFPDFSKRKCRKWWGSLNAEMIKEGVSGIWNDMNEPATGEVSSKEMRFAGEDRRNYSHERYHNEYALLMAQATVEGLKKESPDKRTFVLSRAGSAGIQRYAANWMGDNASRWEHLKMSISMAMGLGLSGQPFVGADIGGFVEPTNPELFIRWMQYGALTPFCRNHNDDAVDQYVWSFGESIQKLCKDAIEMRYRLLPYIYSQFINSSFDGRPVQRPLIYDFQNDPAVRQIDDQYMLGGSILVAPIIEAGCSSRSAYLPEGEWYSEDKNKTYGGKQWITVPTSITSIPIFYKCGKVIPLLSSTPESTMNLKPESLTLLLALPSIDSESVSYLHEDDGLTKKRHKGAYLNTKFTVSHSKGTTSLISSCSGNNFAEFKRKGFILKFAGNPDVHVENFGKEIKKSKGSYKIKCRTESLDLVITLK